MELRGASLIGTEFEPATGQAFHAWNPAACCQLAPAFYPADETAAERACREAEVAFRRYRKTAAQERAVFLEAIATEIEALGEPLLERYVAETGLPAARAGGERARTCAQLRLFAKLLRAPDWDRPEVESAEPDRQPLPKPATRIRSIGVGPVAVFGPCNFPLAFSVAGGDTASALAAGCPVVFKAHPSHPGVSELVARAVMRAAEKTGMPSGVFSLLHGGENIGALLVKHRSIRAVGFTGSPQGGRALFDLAAARPHPIPVFAEMSSINPVLFFKGALESRRDSLVEGLYGSLTMGVGQFCTNPGLILLPPGSAGDGLLDGLREKLAAHPVQPMLGAGVRSGYAAGLQRLKTVAGVETLLDRGVPDGGDPCSAGPALFAVDSRTFLAEPALHEEVFGPVTLAVRCVDGADMRQVVEAVGGQLTVSFHADAQDLKENAALIEDLELVAGRVVANSFPTGVEVCATMVHGGPYPATTDARYTAVGSRAIERFLRPVCYQDFPEADPAGEGS